MRTDLTYTVSYAFEFRLGISQLVFQTTGSDQS